VRIELTLTDDEKLGAAQPTYPLGKCSTSIQLLAYIIVSKYADGLPLYRLEGILKRYGHEVSRTKV
jgi:transposase